MTMRIQPQGSGRPVYLAGSFDLPEVPATDMLGESAGGFLLGEGRYDASLTVRDDRGRACHRDWTIEAKLTAGERAAKVPMPPGSVAELSEAGIAEAASGEDSGGPRLSVLLHAAPVWPQAAKVPPQDVELLLGALSSLMHQAGATTVKLVVFNLDQQREVFRQDAFSLRDLDQVSRAIYSLQLGLVDYKTMLGQKPAGLLGSLVKGEMQAANPADAVVFLGPRGRAEAPPAKDALPAPAAGMPRFFYVEYQAPLPFRERPMPGDANGMGGRGGRGMGGMGRNPAAPAEPSPALFLEKPDAIERAVRSLKGKTLVVHNAGEFARAIEQIKRVKR
jgi:hypothetical protein